MGLTRARNGARLGLKAGEWVVVRSKAEILQTLDARGRLDELPFQPEMFAFCGRRMRVAKSAHKTCDNIKKTGGRRMENAVHLEDSRCNGAAHGGCQADCVFYWKEAWLQRADEVSARRELPVLNGVCTEAMVNRAVKAPGEENSDDPTWVCQVTTVYEATTLLHWWDIRQYIKDVTSGNHTLGHILKLLLAATYRNFVTYGGRGWTAKIKFYNWVQRLRGGLPFPGVDPKIPAGKPTPTQILDLQPGEWVEVKPTEQIFDTLNPDGFNRGMSYTLEMNKYAGGKYRVQMRVDRLINEKTGKMMVMKNPCIQLENVYCRAMCTNKRIGCPRASNTYWREIWLQRTEPPKPGEVTNAFSCDPATEPDVRENATSPHAAGVTDARVSAEEKFAGAVAAATTQIA